MTIIGFSEYNQFKNQITQLFTPSDQFSDSTIKASSGEK